MTRGQVWWYEPPEEKARPVLILTRDEHIDRQLDAITVPITRTIRGWDTEIHIGVTDGLPAESVLNAGNTFLAKQIYLTRQITTLNSVRMTEVCRVLTYATGC